MDVSLESTTVGSYPFPKDDLPVEVKCSRPYAVQIGKAIWKNNRNYGSTLFYNDRVMYRKYVRYALGKQSKDMYKPFLGIDPNSNDKTWLKAINFEIKNYATKRVNIALSKVLSREYEVTVDNIDAVAVDSREDFKARLQVYKDYKNWFDKIEAATGVNSTPDGVDPENLPANSDELELFVEMDYKTAEEIGMELGIKHHMKRCKVEDMRAECAFDTFVLGVAAVYTGMDENILPEIERVDPSELIVPYSKKPNYTELPYAAMLRWMTAAEFRKKAAGYLEEWEIEDVIKNKAQRPEQTLDYTDDLIRYDDVYKIPVLLYNYRSTDTRVDVVKYDEFGNKKMFGKPLDYYEKPKELEKFKNKYGDKRKLYRTEYNTVYEGYWVLNTDYAFRHGPRSTSMRKKGNFSEDLMGFKIFAPNSWNGYIVSTAAQMIPLLDELQRYNLKIQQLVARAIPKGIGIDLAALRKATLKWDNKDMTDQQKIEMFMRSGIFIFSSKERYAPGSNYKPFYDSENGIGNDIEKYLGLIQQALFELDEVIGFTKAAAASQLPADIGKGVTQQQLDITDVSLDYLYKADQRLFKEAAETIAMLHVKSVKYGPKAYYDRIFGTLKTGVTYSSIPFDSKDYGFDISLRTTKQEWTELYQSAEKAYDKGILRYSDLLFIRDIQSIKQARRYLMVLEKKRMTEQSQQSLSLQDANAKTQTDSIQAKLAADKELAQFQAQLRQAEEQDKRQTLTLEYSLKADNMHSEIGLKGLNEATKTSADNSTELVLHHMDNEAKIDLEKVKPKPKPASK